MKNYIFKLLGRRQSDNSQTADKTVAPGYLYTYKDNNTNIKGINIIPNDAAEIDEKSMDNKTARLMELIGSAIEQWASEYHMERLPKKIVFEQALDAMRTIEPLITNRNEGSAMKK